MIGGARELLVQEWKEIPPGDGDELVAALSAEGLASSVTPEIGWVPALAKALRRNGALTPRFALRLTRMLHRASRSRRWGAVTALLADLGRGADLLGPGPLAGVM
ncbi:MAG: hypothetical protein GWN85_38785, partial [Gemmatimonadetes bacterium]|nr:hypothetical protein [Gemmatimonadota bacterium]